MGAAEQITNVVDPHHLGRVLPFPNRTKYKYDLGDTIAEEQTPTLKFVGESAAGAVISSRGGADAGAPSVSTVNFGTVTAAPGAPSQTQTFYVVNTGDVPSGKITLDPSSTLGPFVVDPSSWPTSLAPGESFPITVQLPPQAPGMSAGTIIVDVENVFDGTVTGVTHLDPVTLTGTTIAPAIIGLFKDNCVDPASGLTFATLTLPGQLSANLCIKNTGGQAANLALSVPHALAVFKTSASGNCGATLNAASSCLVKIAFTPTQSDTGSFDDSLSLMGTTYPIHASAITPAAIAYYNSDCTQPLSTLAFGDGVSSGIVCVKNTGQAAGTFTIGAMAFGDSAEFAVSPADAASGGNAPCMSTQTLNSGASCLINVTYTPTGVGTDTTTLTVPVASAGSGMSMTSTLTVTGAGLVKGSFYGQVKQAKDQAPIVGATIVLKQGSSVIKTVSSDSSGNYILDQIPPGSYTLDCSASGYIPVLGRATTLAIAGQTQESFSLSAALKPGEVRITMTWTGPKTWVDEADAVVRDVDSYLACTAADQGKVVYFTNKTVTMQGVAVANLDTDQTKWNGPETITLLQTLPGTCTYYVANYNLQLHPNALGNSNVSVTVYYNIDHYKEYKVAPGSGLTYRVVDIVNGEIIDQGIYDPTLFYSKKSAEQQ